MSVFVHSPLKKGLLLFVCLVILLPACKDKSADFSQEVNDLASQTAQLKCKLGQMNDSIQLAWDQMNEVLSQNIPSSMKPDEIKNMLVVKNAPLIRMFESYQTFGDSVKQALNVVEKQDQEMVTKIQMLKTDLDSLENQKLALFEKIQFQSPEKLTESRDLFASILGKACNH